MRIEFLNTTGRQTNAHVLFIGDTLRIAFSYSTCIAFQCGEEAFRIANTWGPATQKHFNKLGVSNFAILPADEFNEKLQVAIHNQTGVKNHD